MIARRLQTRPMPEPPVRIYKAVAISFLVITVALLGFVIFSIFKKTEVIIIAKENSKTVNMIVNAESEKTKDDSISATVETQEFYWSENFTPTATKPVSGTATGQVTIKNDSPNEMTLIKTTRLLSENNVLFRLSDRYIIPAGASVKANVYADQPGESGDIGPSKFSIPGLSADTQKLVYATSESSMVGGSGKIGFISADDMNAAYQNYSTKVKETFESTHQSNSDFFDKSVVTILSQNASSSYNIGDETSAFTISGTSTVMILSYSSEELKTKINQEINNKVDEGTEKILSINENPKITVANVDSVNKSVQLSVATDVLVTLDDSSTLLEKSNFLNKNKAEIERYVISLPHVTGMDIKFTPSWVTKTPSNPDKLKIVVKSTK